MSGPSNNTALSKDGNSEAKAIRYTLAPRILEESNPSYRSVEELEAAMSKPECKNIALTGVFGSGKSSVIDTYLSKDDAPKNVLRISLSREATQFRKALNTFEFKATESMDSILAAIVNEDFVDSLPKSQALVEQAKKKVDENEVLNDSFKEVKTTLEKAKNEFESEYGKLYENASIEMEDNILEAISKVQLLEPLSEKEIAYTKILYTRLLDRYEANKDDKAAYLRFPGSGEEKNIEKKEEPWGDLLIYHEIISFMAKNHRNAIFLTYDTSKLDWVKKNGEQYSYYVIDAYKNTHQTLLIRKAEDFFTTEFQSTHPQDNDADSVGVVNIQQENPKQVLSGVKASEYKNISREDFVANLKALIERNGDSEDTHISKSFFIYIYLGKQGYRYSKSFSILDKLRGVKVEEYEYNNGNYKYPCLRLITQHGENGAPRGQEKVVNHNNPEDEGRVIADEQEIVHQP